MNSLFIPSSSTLLPSLPVHYQPSLNLHYPKLHYNPNFNSHHKNPTFISLCTTSQPAGTVAMVNFEDLHEKDWSFLEQDDLNTPEEQTLKANLIIAEGEVKGNSKVLVSIPSESFVDRLVEIDPLVVLVAHDSLFVLAGIKEKYDEVKCWQGELIYVPNKWAPFHVVFLCCLPALPFDLDQIFGVVAKHCFEGTRLVISYPQGREGLELQRKEHPDVVISDLPNKLSLEKVAADHSFEITKFVDEPRFYLATLKYFGPVSFFQ
ncbi:hypothetical protein ACHQM5_012305 [Ranunculus cassubicifolius]